jgi:signal peptidase II
MRRSTRNWLIVLPIIVTVFAIDQITKGIVINNLAVGDSIQPIPALSQVFQITHTLNTGAAFGFLPQAGDLFLIVAIVVTVAMIYFYPRIPQEAWITRIATGLVVGGALGNAADRLQHGQVIDFIHYQIPGVISNVSNLADHALVLGVILILIDSWLMERRERRQQAAEQSSSESAISPQHHPGED